jgi:phenylacetic acid degradation operon negative regulatory protein
MDQQYREFASQFRPVLNAIKKAKTLDPLCAFQIRTLLIQEYRKVLLRDPLLPSELLPAGWHGKDAYELCGELYLAVHAQSDNWLSQEMETADGPLPPPEAAFFTRFGGL